MNEKRAEKFTDHPSLQPMPLYPIIAIQRLLEQEEGK